MSEQNSGTGQAVYYAGLAAVAMVIIVASWLLFKDGKQDIEPVMLPPMVAQADTQPAIAPISEPESEAPEPVEPVVTIVEEPTAAPQQLAETSVSIEPTATQPVLPPLPSLNESDKALSADLLALNWKAGLAALFNREEMIRHFVVTVDNVAQGQLVAGQPVLINPASAFQVTEIAESRDQVTSSNAQRYEPYIQLLESVPARQLLALKQRYQPLLDEAFAELGYPDLTFDQRLQQAIAVLLATPSAIPNAELIRPSVMYTYADEKLEALPEAQKQVLRLSPEQQQRFKALLEKYQQALQN